MNFIEEQRAFLDIEPTLISAGWDRDHFMVHASINIENTGETVARNVMPQIRIILDLIFDESQLFPYIEYCKFAHKGMGRPVFKEKTDVRKIMVFHPENDVRQAHVNNGGNVDDVAFAINPFILFCVTYNIRNDDRICYTAAVRRLNQSDTNIEKSVIVSPINGFKIPRERLILDYPFIESYMTDAARHCHGDVAT